MYELIYLVFFINLFLGIYSIKSNYKSRLNLLFSFLSFSIAGIIITNPLIILRENHLLWEKMNIFFVLWTPTLYLLWASEISNKEIVIKDRYLFFVSFLFSLSLLTDLLVKDIIVVNGKYEEVFGPAFNLFFLYYFICFGYGLFLLLSSYWSCISANDKRRNMLAFIGTLIPISASIMINFIFRYVEKYPELTSNIYILPITNSLMMVLFGYAVLKYNLFKPDVSIKEQLDSLRIKILYITNIIIICLAVVTAIIFVSYGSPSDITIIKAFFISIVSIFILDLSITYFLSNFIKKKIVTPINLMSSYAKEVGKGNFNLDIDIEGDDEIAVLSRQMNEMTRKLKKTSEIRENFNKALQIEVYNKTQKLQEAYEKVIESDKAKKDFIDAMAHEIYNPLAIISLSNEFINWDTIGEDNKKMIMAIQRNIQRLISLVKEIENFTVIGLDSQELVIEKLDLKELIDIITQDFIVLASKREIEVSLSSSGHDFHLEGDREKLTKVFVNLIENAVNFSNEGGSVKIRIDEKENNIEVMIKDEGIGIKEKDLGELFERYYRPKIDDELRQGIGLGLPISLDIVTKHDGLIKVKSEYGKGSTFTVILPKKHVVL